MSPELLGSALRRALMTVLLLTLVCVFVPFLPQMPEGPLDPSWAFGMNQSVANGVAFGQGVIFTFGPYASIYTSLYHPATDALMVFGALYLALSYWFAVSLVARDFQWQLVAVLCAALACLMYSRDALLFSYPLIVGVYCYRYADRQDDRGGNLVILALLFGPFGLLPLIKGSLLVLCGATGGLALALLLWRRKLAAGAIAVMSAGLSMLIFWLMAGQPIGALPAWFASMIPIVSGYTEAMSIDGIGWEIAAYLLVAVAMLALVYRSPHVRPSGRTYITLIFTGYLFLAFKGGFVRHDLHAMMAGTSLLLAAIFAAMLFQSRIAFALVAASLLVCVGINRSYDDVSPRRIAHNVLATYSQSWLGVKLRIGDKGRLAAEYERALSALRSKVPMPRLQGTADIYSYHQSYLLASGNSWNPRPVLQSYSAYTPSLLEINRAHLLAANAPDNVAFRVETIDGRIPSSEDGLSWPVLLATYTPIARDEAFVYLRKQEDAAVPDGQVIASGKHEFMDHVVVPAENKPVFARIDLQPTFAGKLVGIFYKPSPLHIRVDLEDGSARVYRIIPGMVRTGMLISPLVESTAEFGQLYQDPARLAGKRVKSFAIAPAANRWHWQPRYGVEFVRYGGAASQVAKGTSP